MASMGINYHASTPLSMKVCPDFTLSGVEV